MKALAIDSAITQLTIAAKNDEHTVTFVYNIGMKQSETLIPAIDALLKKAELTANELDYLTVCKGPGSFTGLRLAFAALKAIEMSSQKPLYGISTLDAYAYPYQKLPFTVLCAVDAKKDRFYAKATEQNKTILEEGDWEPEQIADSIQKNSRSDILICGSDAALLERQLKEKITGRKIYTVPFSIMTTDALFALTEEKIQKKEPPLKDFDGPVYLRASEAEVKLNA